LPPPGLLSFVWRRLDLVGGVRMDPPANIAPVKHGRRRRRHSHRHAGSDPTVAPAREGRRKRHHSLSRSDPDPNFAQAEDEVPGVHRRRRKRHRSARVPDEDVLPPLLDPSESSGGFSDSEEAAPAAVIDRRHTLEVRMAVTAAAIGVQGTFLVSRGREKKKLDRQDPVRDDFFFF
jgi:hypothetical protein